MDFKIEILNKLAITPYEEYTYKLASDFNFKINDKEYYIPVGFITDLMTVPRIFWSIVSPAYSQCMEAAVIHDWLYRHVYDFNRKESDLILYYVLVDAGVSLLRASAIYYAVRSFGWLYFEKG